jgi:hypothetical protein
MSAQPGRSLIKVAASLKQLKVAHWIIKTPRYPDAKRKRPLFSRRVPKEGSPPKSGFTLVYVSDSHP